MSREQKRYYLSIATLVGTVVGVGIFGVPYAIRQVGVAVTLVYFLVLGGIQLLQGLFYAEAAIAYPEKSRLVGLVGYFIGPKARRVATASSVMGFWGAMVAYIIVGGTFLSVLFQPVFGGTEFHYQLIWAALGALIVFVGLDFVAKFDLISISALVLAGLAIFAVSFPHIRLDNFVLFTGKDFFLPYGVILFSLSGISAIPEMEDIMEGRHRHFRRSIVAGSLIATLITAAFGFVVYGVTGGATTPDAVIGLRNIVGGSVMLIGAVFGFLAVSTSYLTAGINLRETFEYDYKFHKWSAWFLATAVPVFVFLFGATSFIGIIGFTGAVFGGITAVLVAWMYKRITERRDMRGADEKPLGVPMVFVYLSITVLVLGAGYEVFSTVMGWFGG